MISYLFMFLLVGGGLAGYWWWTQGRHGPNAMKVHLGLQAEEEIAMVFSGFFQLDFEGSDIAMAAVGVERVGKSFSMTLTRDGELVLKPKGDPPTRYLPQHVRLHRVASGKGKLVGVSGTNEPSDVFQVVDMRGADPYKIRLANSCGVQLENWAAGGLVLNPQG